MSERVAIRIEKNEAQRQQALALMGASACGSCPLMRLGACPGKVVDSAPCPPKPAHEAQPTVAKESYREELMDGSPYGTVMADLRPVHSTATLPKIELPKVVPIPTKKNIPPAKQTIPRPVIKQPPSGPQIKPERKPSIRRNPYKLGEAVADLIGFMIMPNKSHAVPPKK